MNTNRSLRQVAICTLLCIAACAAYGQKSYLCILHHASGKALLLEKGDYIYIEYDGYRCQEEAVTGYILSIDSTGIMLGKSLIPRSVLKTISIEDITGIRKLSALGELAKAAAALSASLAAYSAAGNAGAGRYTALSASVASALGIQLLSNIIFPSKKPRYTASDGWSFSLITI